MFLSITSSAWLFPIMLLALLLSACSVTTVHDDRLRYLDEFERSTVPVCFDYGCKRTSRVKLTNLEWNKLSQLFAQPFPNSQAERQAIAKAVALMEQLTGQYIGTTDDKAENTGSGEPGQMDCIDESTNTTTYLRLFDYRGWLKWHEVQNRVMRSHFIFDVHWTAVIKDRSSKQLYAVDSWFRENGKPPIILELSDWKAKKEGI